MITIPDEILKNLISLANEGISADSLAFDPTDFYSREDAYDSGLVHGEVLAARSLLDSLGVRWASS